MTAIPMHIVNGGLGARPTGSESTILEQGNAVSGDFRETHQPKVGEREREKEEGDHDRLSAQGEAGNDVALSSPLQPPLLILPAHFYTSQHLEADSSSASLSTSGYRAEYLGESDGLFGTMSYTPASTSSHTGPDNAPNHQLEGREALFLPSVETSNSKIRVETPNQGETPAVTFDGTAEGTTELADGQTTTKNLLPPSPPLTTSRAGTIESGQPSQQLHASSEEGEEGNSDWHPLARVGNTDISVDISDSHNNVEGEGGQGIGNPAHGVDLENVLERPADVGYESEKSASRRSGNVPLKIQPPSPQPWDLVEPPERTAHKSENYSTLGSKNFSTMQINSAPRKLIPQSSYYFGPPPPDSAFGTEPVGQIGLHYPREIIRVERDYSGGELIQFAPIFPMELDGRISPTQFMESMNAINEILISAHSLRRSLFDNVLTVITLQLSRLFLSSHYEKEMRRLERLFELLNVELYNPAGLNLVWPRKVAFLYLEIEYY